MGQGDCGGGGGGGGLLVLVHWPLWAMSLMFVQMWGGEDEDL